jgi:hypothetical protein
MIQVATVMPQKDEPYVKGWWISFIYSNGVRRKSLVSLILLVSWEVLRERNARVFRNVATLPSVVVTRLGDRRPFGAWQGPKIWVQ